MTQDRSLVSGPPGRPATIEDANAALHYWSEAAKAAERSLAQIEESALVQAGVVRVAWQRWAEVREIRLALARQSTFWEKARAAQAGGADAPLA